MLYFYHRVSMMLTINSKCTVGSVYKFLRCLITKAKVWCFALAFLFILMPIVKAETITYNVCKSGCEYSDLNTVFANIIAIDNNTNEENDVSVVINISDSESYQLQNDYTIRNINFSRMN